MKQTRGCFDLYRSARNVILNDRPVVGERFPTSLGVYIYIEMNARQDAASSLSVSEHPVSSVAALSRSAAPHAKCLAGSDKGHDVTSCFQI